ncbi:MAG: hypothetical protein ABJG78_06740 [Cyclobacteriaceae bacterium]
MMKKQILLAFVASTILACQEQSPRTADEIITRAIDSYGGKDKLRSIQTRIEEGTTIIYLKDTIYRSSQYISYEKQGGKSYYESPITGEKYAKKLIFASNGEYSWTQNDGALAPYIQPQEEHRNSSGEDYPYLFTLNERGIKAEYSETVMDGYETLDKVNYQDEEGSIAEVFFDQKSGLIRKVRRFIETSQGSAEIIKHYYDHRLINGIMVPFRTESYFPPDEIDSHIQTKVEINQQISDEIFEFPEPHSFSSSEILQLTGLYEAQSKDDNFELINSSGTLQVRMDGKDVNVQVVDPNLLMFRIGEGFGSRICNLIIQQPLSANPVKIQRIYKGNKLMYSKRN